MDNFSSYIECLISQCNRRLFLMKQMKSFSLTAKASKLYIRFILLYEAPAWHDRYLLASEDKLETIQPGADPGMVRWCKRTK